MVRNLNRVMRLVAWLVPVGMLTLGAAGCGDSASTGEPCAAQDCSGHGTCEVVAGCDGGDYDLMIWPM